MFDATLSKALPDLANIKCKFSKINDFYQKPQLCKVCVKEIAGCVKLVAHSHAYKLSGELVCEWLTVEADYKQITLTVPVLVL